MADNLELLEELDPNTQDPNVSDIVEETEQSEPKQTKARGRAKKEESNILGKIVLPNIVELKGVLEKHPYVDVIHVNETGEWHFMPRPGFNPITRQEILNG